jgi:hypothetical protein
MSLIVDWIPEACPQVEMSIEATENISVGFFLKKPSWLVGGKLLWNSNES